MHTERALLRRAWQDLDPLRPSESSSRLPARPGRDKQAARRFRESAPCFHRQERAATRSHRRTRRRTCRFGGPDARASTAPRRPTAASAVLLPGSRRWRREGRLDRRCQTAGAGDACRCPWSYKKSKDCHCAVVLQWRMSADKPILWSVKPLVVVGIGEVLWDVYPDSAHFGGAPANFVSHAASLGAESWMVSAVGADDAGEKAMRTLASLGVRCDLVARDPQHPTGEVRVTLDAQRVPTYTIAPDSAWDHIAWSDELSKFAARCDAVCFGTLAQRSPQSRATIRRFLEEVPRTALRIFDVNLRQRYYDPETIDASLRLASAVKMNEEELAEISTLLDIVRPTRRQMMRRLMDRYNLQLAALTRGAEGALLFDESEEDEAAAPGTIVVDTVGAGDAFTAAMVVDYLRDLPLPLINRHANAVAALVCSQIGAAPAPRSANTTTAVTQRSV